MKKKPNGVLKLTKETLRTLNENVLGDIHGGSSRTHGTTTVVCDPDGAIAPSGDPYSAG